MAGRRMRLKITPAQLRKDNREKIMKCPARHRDLVSFVTLHTMLTSDTFYYTTAQLRGVVEGLELGRMDAQALEAAEKMAAPVGTVTVIQDAQAL